MTSCGAIKQKQKPKHEIRLTTAVGLERAASDMARTVGDILKLPVDPGKHDIYRNLGIPKNLFILKHLLIDIHVIFRRILVDGLLVLLVEVGFLIDYMWWYYMDVFSEILLELSFCLLLGSFV